MNFEKDFFKRYRVNFQKLLNYGFQKCGSQYTFSKIFVDDFRADLSVDKNGILTGKVFDLNTEEEYINFRIEHQIGEFVSHIREEYTKLLEDIRTSCFDREYFIQNQSNRIAKRIFETYQDVPEFPWKDSPGFGIFRNPNNEKWYGLIMNINRKKLNQSSVSEEIEAINVKLDSSKVSTLLTQSQAGFYPAYHMNKKYWITISLDDTLTDEEIFSCIEESHRYTETSGNWIIPANPKFFDVIEHFEKYDTITWKQPKNIHVHDIVYLYLGSPYSAILYKCEVIDINIPYEYQDENLSMQCIMKLKLQEKYEPSRYPFEKLKQHGVRAIRGPRSMPQSLENEMKQK